MAWLNLYKAETNVPIGFQSINQARDNLDYLRDGMLAEHAGGVSPRSGRSSGVGGYQGGTLIQPPWQISPLKTLGHHNDFRIQKGVAYVSHSTAFNGTAIAYLSWASSLFVGVSRFSTGSFFLPVSGLSTFWATVTVYGTSASDVPNLGQVRAYFPPAGAPGTPGIFVQTYAISGGVHVVTDGIPFSVHLYGK